MLRKSTGNINPSSSDQTWKKQTNNNNNNCCWVFFRMLMSECISSFIDQRSYWWMNVLFSIQLTDRMHCAARKQQSPIMQMWSSFLFDTSEELMHGGSITWNQTLFLHSCLSGVFLVFMCCCYCHWFAAYSKQNAAHHRQISVFHQREPKQLSTNWQLRNWISFMF